MTDAPERIWIDQEPYEYNWHVGQSDETARNFVANYIRADVAYQWQPIDTAPKDGSAILLSTEATIAAGYYEPGSVKFGIAPHWRNSCRDKLSFTPTHWAVLPPAPEAAE